VQELLSDDEARRKASILAQRIADLGRGDVAADLVEDLIAPVLHGSGEAGVALPRH
jgi:hypothetical protein